jgi:hypothetical protein
MVLVNGTYSGAVFVEYVLRENADALTEQQLNDIAGEMFETSYEGLVAVYSADMRGVKIVLPYTRNTQSAVDVGIAIGELTCAVKRKKMLNYWSKEIGYEHFEAELEYFDTTIC